MLTSYFFNERNGGVFMNNMQGDLQNQQLKLDYLSAQKATKEF